MCWYPYPGYGQFLPYPHDDIEGGGVGIIFVEEAHMTTVRGHGVAWATGVVLTAALDSVG